VKTGAVAPEVGKLEPGKLENGAVRNDFLNFSRLRRLEGGWWEHLKLLEGRVKVTG